jgi:lipoprotein-anchoring transpeptidase ErfK/SrfK
MLLLCGGLAGVLLLQAAPSPVPARGSTPDPETFQAPAPDAPLPAPATPTPRRVAAPAGQEDLWNFTVHAELPIGRLLEPGEFAWDDEGVPAGQTIIVVNLKAQLLSIYRGGYEIGRSRIIYGADEKPTPTGTFPILEKDARHFSNLYDGAPMPHMLRLTTDGVAIHGSEIAENLVTHGCVGLPKEFAALLFAAAEVGDPVLVSAG